MFGHIAQHYSCQTTDRGATSCLRRRKFPSCPAETILGVTTDNYIANHFLTSGEANRFTASMMAGLLWS